MQTLGKLIFAHPLPVLALTVCMIAPAVGGGQQDSRKAWQHKIAAGDRTIFDTGGGKWIVYTPKGATFIYLETSREADYIEMRSTQNENVFRLFQNHGEIRKTADGPWARFATGRWLEKPDAYKFDKFGPLDYNLRSNVASSRSGGQKVQFSEANAHLLMCSRYLAQDIDRLDYQPPQVDFQLDRVRDAVVASVTATDDKGLRAAVFVDENHTQRTMVLARKLSGKRQEVKKRLPASVLNSGAAKIKVMVVETGGNYTQLTRSTR